MDTIVNQALSVLNDLELNIDEVSRMLPAEEKNDFLNRVAQVEAKLKAMIEGSSFTERELEEVANRLIEEINQYGAVTEAISADEEISSSQERAARLTLLEESEMRSLTGQAKPAAGKSEHDRKREQHTFLANQMITKLDVIRNAMRS
jgi:hypothetical protein